MAGKNSYCTMYFQKKKKILKIDMQTLFHKIPKYNVAFGLY